MTQSRQETAFVCHWLAEVGPRLEGERLWRALGFGSRRSFERAAQRGTLGVKLYPQLSGRGRFARTEEVARYLWRELERRKAGGGMR